MTNRAARRIVATTDVLTLKFISLSRNPQAPETLFRARGRDAALQGLHHLVDREAADPLARRVVLEALDERLDLVERVLCDVRVLRVPVVVLVRDDVRALVGV